MIENKDTFSRRGLAMMKTSTPLKTSFEPSPLYEMAARIASSRQITAAERSVLRRAFLEQPLTEEEHRLINRIHRALLRGRIQLI